MGQPTRLLAYGIQLASLETTSSFEFLFCRGISRSRNLRNKVAEQLPQRPFEPTQVFWKVKSIAQNVREMTKEGLFIGHSERNKYKEKHKRKRVRQHCVIVRLRHWNRNWNPILTFLSSWDNRPDTSLQHVSWDL